MPTEHDLDPPAMTEKERLAKRRYQAFFAFEMMKGDNVTITDDRRIYDASGKLVYAPRSNVGLSADELFPGPGAGFPRRMGMTAITLAQSGEIMGPETEDLLQGD